MYTLYVNLSDEFLPFKIGRSNKPYSKWCNTIFTALRNTEGSPSGCQPYPPSLEVHVLKVPFDLVSVDLYKSTLQEVRTFLQNHHPELLI